MVVVVVVATVATVDVAESSSPLHAVSTRARARGTMIRFTIGEVRRMTAPGR